MLPPIECPNCRREIARLRIFTRTAWSRWHCVGCGSLLGVDTKRRLLAMIPWVFIVVVLLFVLEIVQWGLLFAIPVLLGLALANFFVFDRVVLIQRTGRRCRQCGYDLTGQSDDRCPECGGAFDTEQIAAEAAPDARLNRSLLRRRVLIAIVFAVLTLAVLLSLIVTKMRGSRTPAPPGTGGVPATPDSLETSEA